MYQDMDKNMDETVEQLDIAVIGAGTFTSIGSCNNHLANHLRLAWPGNGQDISRGAPGCQNANL